MQPSIRPQPAELDALIAAALARLDRAMPRFADSFPAPSSVDGIYAPIDNIEWTNGFWTGMLWLAGELSRNGYREAAERNVQSFLDRVEQRINVDHHDLGFLYTLSACAGHRLTGSDAGRTAGIVAARLLLARFDPVANVISTWKP